MTDDWLTPFGMWLKSTFEVKWYRANGRTYVFVGPYYRRGFSFGRKHPPARMKHEDAVRVAEIGRKYLGEICAASWTGRA